jgi:hypothetical protein
MGEVLVDQIPGGLTVMSTVAPGSGARRGLSPVQTPYFRLLFKGERLTPRPGRADDFSWPRPQATAEMATDPAPETDAAPQPEAAKQSTRPRSRRTD